MTDIETIAKMVKPVNKQIILMRDTGKTQTDAGLHIGDINTKKLRSGIVVCYAEDCTIPLEIGLRVGHQKHAGTNMEIMVGDEAVPITIMPENSVTMIMHEDAKLGVSDG
jgi:co-chaperonin GroES (HSP10)